MRLTNAQTHKKEREKMRKGITLVTVAFVLCGVVFAQAPIPYETGFEAPDFTAGQSINGQDSWQVLSETDATITDALAQAGSQSVSLEAGSQIDKALTGTGHNIVWMEGYFRGAGSSTEPEFPKEPGASAIVFFSATDGIRCLNGNGSGGGDWVDTGVTLVEAQWYKISIRQDYTTRKWNCYVDGALKASDLGFRDVVSELHGFRDFADTQSYLDTFRVIPVLKGDVNGDRKLDVADVVSLLNHPGGSGITDLILLDNADVDNSGTIDATDVTALINILLAR